MTDTSVITLVYTDSPLSEMWSHLGRFEVSHRVRDGFGVSDESARAAGDCVRQARELFRSAHTSSLLTRPILLYYGMVSLSKLVLLLDDQRPMTMEEIEAHEKQGHGMKQDDQTAGDSYSIENTVIQFMTNESKKNPQPRGMFLQIADRISHGSASSWGNQRLTFGELLRYVPQIDSLVGDSLGRSNGYLGFHVDVNMTFMGNIRSLNLFSSYEKTPHESTDEAIERVSYVDFDRYSLESRFDRSDDPDHEGSCYAISSSDLPLSDLCYREEFTTFAHVLPPAFLGVRFDSILANYVLMYALSIVARYKPHRWARILEGRESTLLPVIERLMWVCERWWPNMMLNYFSGHPVCFAAPSYTG